MHFFRFITLDDVLIFDLNFTTSDFALIGQSCF